MTDAQQIRVLIVDDDPLARSGVASLLRSDDGVVVVGEARDGDEVVAAVRQLRPDVVFMDMRMQRLGGVDATRLLQREVVPPKVIALTAFNEDRYVVDALDAGATGFLLKDSPPADFRRAVRTALAGDAFLDPKSTRYVIHRAPRASDVTRRCQQRLEALSEREREVARLVWETRSNAEIAETLYMGETTVKTHVSHLMQKLDCINRIQVALVVERAGGLYADDDRPAPQ